MARTDVLRRQHDALLMLVGDVQRLVGEYRTAADAHEIGMALAKLSGLVRIHFAQEDRALYPAMISSPDPEVASVAQAYQDELGGLGRAYAQYVGKWSGSGAIAGNFALFRAETAAVLGALADRIERENDHLYPLADVMDERVRSAA